MDINGSEHSYSTMARPYRALTIGAVALMSLIAFEAVAVTTAMPTVVKALNGISLYALAFGGALAAGIVGLAVAGVQADRRGPGLPMWVGVATFAIGLTIAGLAPNMWVLIGGRVIQGYGGGLVAVALYVVVGRAYPAQLHPRMFTAFAAAWVLPSIVGPYLAGLGVEHLGWRWVFLVVVGLVVPAALLVWPALRGLTGPAGDSGSAGSSRTPWAMGVAVSAGVLYVAGQRTDLVAVLLSAVAIAGLVWCAPKLFPRGTFRAGRGLPSVILLRGLAGAAFIETDVFLPLMLSRERGFPPSLAGLTLMVGGLAWSLGSWVDGRFLGQRLAKAVRLRTGLSLIAAGVALAMCCVASSVPVWVCVVGWMIGGFGMGICYPALSTLTLELSPPAEQGVNSAALQLSDSLQSTAALAIGGSLFAALLPVNTPAAYLTGYGIALLLAMIGVFVAAFRFDSAVPSEAAAAPVASAQM
jgi:MFS family permease